MANENLKPMTWDELRRLPEYARCEYINALRQEFGCGVGQMAELLGMTKKDFVRETELLGLDLSGARPARDPEKIAAWEKFCGIEHGIVHELASLENPVAETGELKVCHPRLPAIGSDGAAVKIVRMELEIRGTIWDIIGALEPYSEAITDQAVARIMIGGAGE